MTDGSDSAPANAGRATTFLVGDPLRAVAALAIVVYHTSYFVAPSPFYRAFGSLAGHVRGGFHLGLFVFFSLSGYLISKPFVHAFVA